MVSLSSCSLLAPTLRRKLYAIITFIVISSLLLQPVTAIAALYQSERAKVIGAALIVPNTEETGEVDSRSAPEEMSTTDQSPIAATLPKPTKRLLAQVSPIPSYARPVYPYNHILDKSPDLYSSPVINHDFEMLPVAGATPPFNHDFQLPAMGGGTLPTNHDFQTPVMGGGSPPSNYQFSAASYQVGTPPTNYNFATGTITDWQGRANTLTYDADGNLAGIARYNNVNTAYTYDAAGRLDALNHSSPAGSLAWFDYTLDDVGNRTAVTSQQGPETYDFDGLNRLISASYPDSSTGESFSYRYNGDRNSAKNYNENYVYNDAGQLEMVMSPMAVDSKLLTYDRNGNTLTSTDGAQQTDSYTWDWANRLTSATVDGQTVNYAYDAMGVRVSATISGTTQNLLWDRMAELPLLVDDGSQSYLHGAGPLAQIDAAGTRYDLLADGLGSVRNLIDGSGAVVGAADYNVFGVYRNQTGVTSRFGFTGEYYAQETGMWHLRARDLHPGLGRFLSADPVQPNAPGTQGYNRYAYVANNPTTWVDPSGYTVEEPLPEDTAILAGTWAMNAPSSGFANAIGNPLLLFALTIKCGLIEGCLDLAGEARELIVSLGSLGLNTYVYSVDVGLCVAQRVKFSSLGLNTYVYSVDALQNIFFSTYPHQPTPVDPGLLVLSMGLSNTPVIGDLYDLYTGVTGYDPITQQYLAGWERLANIVGALPIFGVSGANMRHGEHAFESLIDNGDEMAQFVSQAARKSNDGFEDFRSLRFRVKYDHGLPAGEGFTDEMGNIFLSPRGTRTDRLQALYHEQVHAFILKNPVLRPLSQVGYSNSQLWRYTEEAIAESRAQLLTGGRLVDALSHPFHPHYRITRTGLLIEAGAVGVLAYGAYWTWNQITSCDSSGNC